MAYNKRHKEVKEMTLGLELRQELRTELQLSQRCELKDILFYAPITILQSGLDVLKRKEGIDHGIYIGTGASAGEYVIVNGQVNPFKVKEQKCTDGCQCQRIGYKGEKGIKILASAIKEAAEVENLHNVIAYNTTKRQRVRKLDLASDDLEAALEFELTR